MNVETFKQAMSKLPEPVTELKPPYWDYWRHDLWQRVQTQDPTQFWEWPCVYHTMLVEHWPGPIAYELSQLDSRFHNACSLPHFGPGDGELTNEGYLSRNLIHQAYHIQQWEQATGRRINQLDTIVEFGGGYGAMALLCHRLGFDGKYIIYDLPEFSLLQEYYLSHFGILVDKVTWNPKKYPKNIDLFMALYSTSEVDTEGRYIPTRAKSYLFLYSGQWERWDNVSYFHYFVPSTSEIVRNWQHTEIMHLPDPQNFYSIGY